MVVGFMGDYMVDIEETNLREKGVETVHFLSLFDKSVILSDTAQCQFVHEVDLVRRVHMFVLNNS